MSTRDEVLLIEIEARLALSVQRVGRAVRNMSQEVGGYPSKTPGSGDPGGGKGGGPSVVIDRLPGEPLRAPQDPKAREQWESQVSVPSGDAVAVTAPELVALGFAGRDQALADLERLTFHAADACSALSMLVAAAAVPAWPSVQASSTVQSVVWAYGQARRLRRLDRVPDAGDAILRASKAVGELVRLCEVWGYTPGKPHVTREALGLLAVDQTLKYCVSHLRIGARVGRQRPDVESDEPRSVLCDWCYKHGPLLMSSWDAPPVGLVRLKVDQGRVHAHELEPFLHAERDRLKRLRKKRRR